MTEQEIRNKIQVQGLRITGTRIMVYKTLLQAERPLSHTDVVRLLQRNSESYGDQATIYRTLQVFTEKGLIQIGSKAGGIDRYEIKTLKDKDQETHVHPHFVCRDCGIVSCLPKTTVITNYDKNWQHVLEHAEMQFVGTCQDCI
tara:strand:- start:141 stop:572 length:432 start_codon:yes stop_codon:yes gene_type:complete